MRKAMGHVLVAVLWLGLWQLAALAVGQELLLPSPLAVVRALGTLLPQGSFWRAAVFSLGRILCGFAAACLCGGLIAAGSAAWPPLGRFLRPPLAVIKATPVASFIILLLVWLRVGAIPAVTAFLIVLPGMVANVETGIVQTNAELLEMARVYRISPGRRLMKIYLPSVRPYFLAAVRSGMGMAWKAGVAAEVICRARDSMGGGLYDAKIYLDTPGLFAWTAATVLLSIGLERLVLWLAGRERGRG